jgi:hypothetical protein
MEWPDSNLRQTYHKLSFQTCIACLGKLVLEFLDSTCCIDKLQLAGIERMAEVANIDFQFFAGTAGLKRIATATGNRGVMIFRVYVTLHGLIPLIPLIP